MKDFSNIDSEYQKVAKELMELYVRHMNMEVDGDELYVKEEELLYQLRLLAMAKNLFDMNDIAGGVN